MAAYLEAHWLACGFCKAEKVECLTFLQYGYCKGEAPTKTA
jgi:hypothetical protein